LDIHENILQYKCRAIGEKPPEKPSQNTQLAGHPNSHPTMTFNTRNAAQGFVTQLVMTFMLLVGIPWVWWSSDPFAIDNGEGVVSFLPFFLLLPRPALHSATHRSHIHWAVHCPFTCIPSCNPRARPCNIPLEGDLSLLPCLSNDFPRQPRPQITALSPLAVVRWVSQPSVTDSKAWLQQMCSLRQQQIPPAIFIRPLLYWSVYPLPARASNPFPRPPPHTTDRQGGQSHNLCVSVVPYSHKLSQTLCLVLSSSTWSSFLARGCSSRPEPL
jgi:hypothetical protein